MEQNNRKIEDEIDFRDVLKNPKRWFGLIYPLFIVVIVVIGAYYINNMDTIARNSIIPSIEDSTKLFKEPEVVKGASVTGIDLNLIKSPTPEFIKKGGELYANTCAACHGEKGMGDGVAGAALNPKPRNFTSVDGWKNGRKLGDMFKTLKEGIPNSGMVAYEFMPLEDRFALIFYVRSLSNNFPALTEAEINELNNTYKLTESRNVSSQVTTSMAIDALVDENAFQADYAQRMLEFINNHNTGNGYLIFQRVVKNKEKLVFALQNSDTWKQNVDVFLSFAVYGSPYNGFDVAVADLNKEELTELQQYLISVAGL